MGRTHNSLWALPRTINSYSVGSYDTTCLSLCVTRRFIYLPRQERIRFLTGARWIHSTYLSLFNVHLNIVLPCVCAFQLASSIEFSTKALYDVPKIQLTPLSGADFPCETNSRSAYRQTPCIVHYNSTCSHIFTLTLKYLCQRHILEHSRQFLLHKWRDQFSHSYRAAGKLILPCVFIFVYLVSEEKQ